MMPETNPILLAKTVINRFTSQRLFPVTQVSVQTCSLEYPFLNGLANCQSVRIPLDHLHRNMWRLEDVFTSRESEQSGDEMSGQGLRGHLPPWGFHFTFSDAGRPEGV